MNTESFSRQRPVPTEADQGLQAAVRRRVGTKRAGHVVVISPEIGTGYVQDDKTGVHFAFAKKYLPGFDRLAVGMAVEFYENGRNAVAELHVS